MARVQAQVRSAAILWKEVAERTDPATGDTVTFSKRCRARKGQIVDLPEAEFERLLVLDDVQRPGEAPLPGSVVEATPNARPFNDGEHTVAFDDAGSAPAPKSAAPPATAGEPDLETAEGLAAHIVREELNAGDTVALAGTDANRARLVIEAEKACDGEPRVTVLRPLQKIIDGD